MKRRALAALVALLAVVWVTASSALAQPEVSLTPAADGSLIVVGDGWRPGQRLIVSLGRDVFPVFADSAGSFELPTGVVGSINQPLSVRRLDATAPWPAHLELAAEDNDGVPNPLAVLFAHSILLGAAGAVAGLGGLAAVIRVRARREA